MIELRPSAGGPVIFPGGSDPKLTRIQADALAAVVDGGATNVFAGQTMDALRDRNLIVQHVRRDRIRWEPTNDGIRERQRGV